MLFFAQASPSPFALARQLIFIWSIGIELGIMPASFMQALPGPGLKYHVERYFARDPLLHFHGAWCLNDQAWPKICLDTIGQLFGPCVVAGLCRHFVGALLAAKLA